MDSVFPHLFAVVVCGQSGSNLWPLTRSSTPRETTQLSCDSENLLAATIRRAKPLTSAPIVIACPASTEFQIEDAIEASGLLKPSERTMLVEPYPRGTALSVALAAAKLKLLDPNAYLLVMPSHLSVRADDRWGQAIARAYRAAAEDMVAVLAVKSHESIVTHSYVRPGSELPGIVGANYIATYVRDVARHQQARHRSQEMLWSTNIVVARASTILAQLAYAAKHSPDPACRDMDRVSETAMFLASIDQAKWSSAEARELVQSLPDTSFEQAIFGQSPNTAVVPTSMECTAIGSLADLDDIARPDIDGNRMVGRGFAIDSTNTTIYDDDRLTVVLGCDDVMVVNTRDSVLVASKDALDSIGEVLPTLQQAGASEADRSSVRQYPWGTSTVLFQGDQSAVKLVAIAPGKAIDTYARLRVEESWNVLEGAVSCKQGGSVENLTAGQHAEFAIKTPHQIKNAGDTPALLTCTEHAIAGVYVDDDVL